MTEKTNHISHSIQPYLKWLTSLLVLLFLISGCGQKNQDKISSIEETKTIHNDHESGDNIGDGQSGGAILDPNVIEPSEATAPPDPIVAEPSSVAAPEPPVAASMEAPKKVETSAPSTTSTKPTKTQGNILYNPPKNMILHDTQRIEVRIGHDKLDTKGLIGTGKVIRDELPISEYMTVRLCCGTPSEDHAFDIVALNAERQIVDKTGFTQWAFNVTPRKSGKQYLNLSVSTHYTYPNGEIRTKDSPVKTDQILINVDTKQETQNWLMSNWKWLSLLLLIPLLVFYVMRNLKAKRRKVSRSGDESIFISYRRNDSSGYTLAIYEQLKSTFSDDHVFMDMDDIPHGEDFVEHIEKVLSSANTVLVMIGEKWLNAENANGRRLDDPGDFVRLEIATALKRKIRVIPVLLQGATMPSEADLPEDLQALARKNAIRIHDDQFEGSVQKLIKAVDEAS